MSKITVRPLREGLTVRFVFARPILSWEGVGGRFIAMLYDSFSPKIQIRSNEISSNNSTVLGEIWIRYSIFGGGSSITLSSDQLTIDFQVLTTADFPIALDILRTVHDVFPKTFPEQGCERIEGQVAEHLEMSAPGDIDRFLQQFRIAKVDAAFKDTAVQMPSVKFGLVSEREKWQYSLMIERSLVSANAIFVLRTITLQPVDLASSFEEKYELVLNATLRCFAALGLETENVATET